VSHRDDAHAYAVLARLRQISNRDDVGMLFDTATLPVASRISVGQKARGDGHALSVHPPLPEICGSSTVSLLRRRNIAECLVSVPLERVRAVYWRRPRPSLVEDSLTDPDLRLYAAKASRETIEGTVEALALRCRVVDRPSHVTRASLKVLQLETARRARLRVPQSLITNSPDDAARFVKRLEAVGTQVISKSPTDLDYFSARTEIVDRRKLDQLAAIALSPTILQERIVGGPDLRITVVGSRVFGMAQTSRPEFEADARLDPAPRREPFDVPARLRQRILTVQRALGLSFGAYDFKCDALGQPYFLEVNPIGQWLGTELATGAAVAEALALYLWRGAGAEWATTLPAIQEEQLESLFPPAVQEEYAVMRHLANERAEHCLETPAQ
jgi:glutathione synthase/RimK-type ligase-like ATP-grasp enzyme